MAQWAPHEYAVSLTYRADFYAISFKQKMASVFFPPTNIALLSQLLNIAVPTVDYTGRRNAAACLAVYKAAANRSLLLPDI
jgi:hypothetical protein